MESNGIAVGVARGEMQFFSDPPPTLFCPQGFLILWLGLVAIAMILVLAIAARGRHRPSVLRSCSLALGGAAGLAIVGQLAELLWGIGEVLGTMAVTTGDARRGIALLILQSQCLLAAWTSLVAGFGFVAARLLRVLARGSDGE